MGKKKKNQKSKTSASNIGSSSLLPARHDGEKPDTPYKIKTEPVDDLTEKELLSFLEESKRNTVTPEDAETSNHSGTSTATEPMENDERIANYSGAEDLSENQVVPTLFKQVHMKQEPMEFEVADNRESTVGEFMPNNHVKNSLENEVFIPIVNDQVKKEPIENNELIENNQNTSGLHKNSHEMLPTKRKKDKKELEERLQLIRKKFKTEPVEEGQINENQVERKNSDDDQCSNDTETEEVIDNDIYVLTVPKTQKQVDVITISDEEDENSESQNVSTINSPKKAAKERNFSIDILKYFNVVSELDRHECQIGLENLSKYKTKNALQKFFPIVKREEISKDKIQKGDILFRRAVIDAETDRKKASIFPNIVSNFHNKLPVQPEAASQYVNSAQFVNPALQSVNDPASQYFNVPVQPEAASQHSNFAVPPASQSTMISPRMPIAPVSSNFAEYQIAASSSTSNSNIGESGCQFSLQDLKNIFNMCQKLQIPTPLQNMPLHHPCQAMPLQDPHQNMPLQNPHQNMVLQDPHQNITLQDPRKNIALQDPHQNITLQDPLKNIALQDPHQNIAHQKGLFQNPHQNTTLQDIRQNSPIHDPHQNSQLHDPRLKKKPRLESGNNTHIANSVPIHSQPVAPLPTTSQRFPGSRISSHPSLSPANQEYPKRKGVNDLLLYQNVGRDDINPHFETLILQWNPSWMEIQKKTGVWPPICHSYPTVVYFYRNEMDYYNTYVPLHLLHLWYCIYQCWESEKFMVIEKCKVQSVEKIDNGFKISCSVELEDAQLWPKRDDVILCKHNREQAFFLVVDVKKRPTHLSRISKLKISLESLDHLNLKLDDEINFCILWNIRTAFSQTDALNSLDNSMKELVLKPESHSNCIKNVRLDVSKAIKEQRDSVLQVLILENIRVIMIETYPMFNSVHFLTLLTYSITEKSGLTCQNEPRRGFTVLIIIRNDELFSKLYKFLSPYKPVLAVRTKQIKLTPELISHTLEYRLDRKENLNDILNNHKIFITTFSAFGHAEKGHLSKLRNLICIIDDANLCTEVETALPLTLKIKKLLLIGNRFQHLNLPDVLKKQNYQISLFVRLLKAIHEL